MNKSVFMGYQLFLRICHQHSVNQSFGRIQFSAFYICTLIAGILLSTPINAEPNVISNVAGDEIIIFTDDTFKPATRDLSGGKLDAKETASKNTVDEKSIVKKQVSEKLYPQYTRGGRLSTALEINLNPSKINESRINDDVSLDQVATDESAEETSDISNEDVQAQHDDLWQRIKNGYAMPESTSPLTARHEAWYSSRPDYVQRMVERSQRYLFHIVEEVEKRGMPTEIALLPMIESAYNPTAYSKSKASGIWQFIPSTGKHFGLKQNWWVDNRRNITFATDAALNYLQKLHGMFGAWDLALAAYNAGEGTIARAIEKNRKRGLPTDYESLSLPDETKNYVPKLQAVKNLMTHPENYGLEIQTIANTPYFAKVSAPAKLDAHLAARLAEINHEEFIALNPSYNRPVMTSDKENLELLLPIMSAQTFRANLANYNQPLVSWQTYQAKRGERMDKIAKKFGIALAKLRDINNLPAQTKLKKNATILVPNQNETGTKDTTIALNTDSTPDIEPSAIDTVTHKVKKGEVMQAIANRYGVTVKQIMAANSLKNSRLKVGQLLMIDASGSTKSGMNFKNDKKPSKKQTYIVKLGDTLHSIAEKFDVAVSDLKRWNNKSNNHIIPGTRLIIMQSDAA